MWKLCTARQILIFTESWCGGLECSPLRLPELVHFNHLQDELGYHLSETKCVTFSFLCVSWWHGLWKEDSIISSVFKTFVWYCQFLIYSGSRMKNLFWLFSNGFQPRSLQMSHLFLEEEMNRVYVLHSYRNWFPFARSPEDMELLDTMGKGDCLLGDL